MYYSKVLYLKNIDYMSFKELINIWREGTKIYFFTDNEECLEAFKIYHKETLGYLNKFPEFNWSLGKVFNLEIYRCKSFDEEFSILDGKREISDKRLETIIEETTFNLEMYKIEHIDIKKDILIKAKAGTGKTYSMISRINYLIFKKGYKPSEIREHIYGITFTNEATFNMKSRLKKHYENLYILTRDIIYLEILEEIERMRISTIHKFLKEIIDSIGVRIEFGDKIKVYSGKEKLNKIVLDEIDIYEKEGGGKREILRGINLYEIEKVTKSILGKIEQKNIRIEEGYDLGEGDNRVRLVNTVLEKSQKRMLNESKKENKIRLNEHFLFALEGIEKISEELRDYFKIEYLFIDEFQDTDEGQIKILNKLREKLGFKMFIVGDINQAIYRFRGADYTAFDEIDKEKMDLEVCTLTKNYRTGSNLLNEINKIFTREKKYLDYSETLIGVIEDKEAKLEEWKGSLVNLAKLLKRDNPNETTAILVRNNSNIKMIIKEFKGSNISIKTNVAENLYEHKGAWDLYILVLAMKFNNNPLYLLNLENTNYTTKVSDKEYLFTIKNDKEEKIKYIKNLNMIDGFEKSIESLKKEPTMKVLRNIKEKTRPWLLESSEEEQRKYKSVVEQLFEVIIDTYNGEYLTINKICTFLELAINTKMVEEIKYKEDLKGGDIICSTIHKSKGLEFDNVIIPYVNTNIIKSQSQVDVIIKEKKIGYKYKMNKKVIENNLYRTLENEEREERVGEEIRNLYVAVTRGKKRVYWSKESNKKVELSWKDIIEGRICE